MEPVKFIKPSGDDDIETLKKNWELARDFTVNLILAAGLTPGTAYDGEYGAFGKHAELDIEIVEYPGVCIGTLTCYGELEYNGTGPQTSHFEVGDDNGLISLADKDLIYDSPQEVIDQLKKDLERYVA